jgi:phage shock protein C
MDRKYKKLRRKPDDSVIAGVCGGLGVYFDLDPVLFRMLFLFLTFTGGSGILIYFTLWLLIPREGTGEQPSQQTISENGREMKKKAEEIFESVKTGEGNNDERLLIGLFLLLLGIYFILNNLGLLWWVDVSQLWPIGLIGLGIILLIKR